MLIEVKRFEFKDTHTIGKMYVDGVYECYTLEDVVRNGTKVLGKTAIPIGEYKLIVDASVRFKQDMPHILNVPDFTGVRIHSGNTSADTDGCILLGTHGLVKTL
jgi:dynactin complex subunit